MPIMAVLRTARQVGDPGYGHPIKNQRTVLDDGTIGIIYQGASGCKHHITPLDHIPGPFYRLDAYSVFFLKSVTNEVSTMELYRGAIPFVLIFIVGIVIIYAFPQLSLWLPGILGG